MRTLRVGQAGAEQGAGPRQQRGAHRPRRRAEPQHGLLDVAAVGDPLRLGAVRHRLVRNAGRHLQRGGAGSRTGRPDRPGQRRRVRLRVEDPAATAPPRGIDEHGVVPTGVDFRDIGLAHLDQPVQPQRPGVGAGSGGRRRVPVHGQHPDPGPGQRDRVAADPAAQVGDRGHAQGRHPLGPVRGHARPRRLLDPVGREEHPPGVLGPELRRRALPQPRLPERGRHQLGGVRAPQPGRHRQLRAGSVSRTSSRRARPSGVSRARRASRSFTGTLWASRWMVCLRRGVGPGSTAGDCEDPAPCEQSYKMTKSGRPGCSGRPPQGSGCAAVSPRSPSPPSPPAVRRTPPRCGAPQASSPSRRPRPARSTPTRPSCAPHTPPGSPPPSAGSWRRSR